MTAPISWRRALGNITRLLQFDPIERAEHDYRNVFLKGLQDLQKFTNRPLHEQDLLILGCGYTYPEVILYTPHLRRVVGLDILTAFYRDGIRATAKDIHRRGGRWIQAWYKALVFAYKYARYYDHLAQISGTHIQHPSYTLFSYDGDTIPVPDATFDIVLSNAVLEHVMDMERLVQELHRITRPGGLSYHLWHNYYSLSGGHVHPDLYTRLPWGHLRGLYETRGVNRLRPEAIVKAFSLQFHVEALYHVDAQHRKLEEDPDFRPEGADLLTETIRQELSEYPEDLLLTRAFLIVARKPA